MNRLEQFLSRYRRSKAVDTTPSQVLAVHGLTTDEALRNAQEIQEVITLRAYIYPTALIQSVLTHIEIAAIGSRFKSQKVYELSSLLEELLADQIDGVARNLIAQQHQNDPKQSNMGKTKNGIYEFVNDTNSTTGQLLIKSDHTRVLFWQNPILPTIKTPVVYPIKPHTWTRTNSAQRTRMVGSLDQIVSYTDNSVLKASYGRYIDAETSYRESISNEVARINANNPKRITRR